MKDILTTTKDFPDEVTVRISTDVISAWRLQEKREGFYTTKHLLQTIENDLASLSRSEVWPILFTGKIHVTNDSFDYLASRDDLAAGNKLSYVITNSDAIKYLKEAQAHLHYAFNLDVAFGQIVEAEIMVMIGMFDLNAFRSLLENHCIFRTDKDCAEASFIDCIYAIVKRRTGLKPEFEIHSVTTDIFVGHDWLGYLLKDLYDVETLISAGDALVNLVPGFESVKWTKDHMADILMRALSIKLENK